MSDQTDPISYLVRTAIAEYPDGRFYAESHIWLGGDQQGVFPPTRPPNKVYRNGPFRSFEETKSFVAGPLRQYWRETGIEAVLGKGRPFNWPAEWPEPEEIEAFNDDEVPTA